MSRFQTIVLLVFGILALAGVIVFATYTGSGSGANVGTVTVWGTLPAGPIERALATLAEAKPEYKSVSYIEKRPETFLAELTDALASGTGPDLILDSQENLVPLSNKLYTIPYDTYPERTFRDAYADGAAIFLSSGGVLGIPLAADPLVLYYNRGLVSSAGIASAPSVWEQVYGLVTKITTTDKAQNVTRAAVALGEYGNVRNARAILSALLMQAGVPIVENTDQGLRAALTVKSESILLGEAPVRFYTVFADPAKSSYTWNRALPESRAFFLANDLALYFGFASELPFIRAANPNLNFDVAPFLQPATAATNLTYGRIYAFMIPSGSVNKNGAYQVALALSDPTVAVGIVENLSIAPIARTLLAETPADPFRVVFQNQALVARGWLSPSGVDADQVFFAMIANVTTGRLSIPDALVVAERSLGQLLR